MVTVIIPTIRGREETLARVVNAYRETGADRVLTSIGHKTAGEAGNDLMLCLPHGCEHVLLTTDDMLPHAGWLDAALKVAAPGVVPVARCLRVDGQPLQERDGWEPGRESSWTRLFFLSPATFKHVGAFLDATWYIDLDYCERLQAAGYKLLTTDGFTFTHLDGPRDWHTPEVDKHEVGLYHAAQRERKR